MVSELKELEIPYDILSHSHLKMRGDDERSVLDFYLDCIANGTAPRLAEALAMQQAPGVGITDTTFIADQNRFGRSILDRYHGNPKMVEVLRRNLAKHGYKLQSDDHYIPTVARFPGDPQAIVNHTQTLGDLQRNIERRGMSLSDGAINANGGSDRPPVPEQIHRLNPEIVKRIDGRNVKANPDLAKVPVRDRHAEIVDRHGSAPVKS